MSGIFDQILDHYDGGEEEWRLFLYEVLEKITRKSALKKSLPSYIKVEDFLSETFLVMDEIARSDIPRKEKITKLFACSRFTNVPQKSRLWLNSRVVYNLNTYDNDWDVCEKSLVYDAPTVNWLLLWLESAWLIDERELQIARLLWTWCSFRQVAKALGVSPSRWWVICNELREKIKHFKDTWYLEDDYHSWKY